MFLLALALLQSPQQVYYAWGWHGGYYLTDEVATQQAFDKLFELLKALPHLIAVLEIEPYTVERMLRGEKFEVERHGRVEPKLVGWQIGGVGKWSSAVGKEFARSRSVGVRLEFKEGEYVHALQQVRAEKVRGKTLIFSGYIRSHKGFGAHLYIDGWDASGYIAGSSHTSERVPPDGKWHFVKVEMAVPPKAMKIFPQAKIAFEPTTADFDDLSLIVKETGEEILTNGDFEQLEVLTLKDISRLKKLQEFVKQRRVEIVGGAYTQPIMFTIGDESVIRQFVLGCKAIEEALKTQVKIYAAQEPNMVGQLPQILSKLDFIGVLYRTYWGAFGFTPSRDEEMVLWVGPDGTEIECIPLPEPMRNGWVLHSPSLRVAQECARRNIWRLLFTSFGDFIASWFPDQKDPRIHGIFAEGWVNLCKRIDAIKLRGKQLELSAWVRTRYLGAHIYIDAHDEKGVAKGGVQSENAPADGKWHLLRLTFRVPEDAVYIFPQCRIISNYSEADFDGVSLRVVETGEEILPEGSFEDEVLPKGWSVSRSEGAECKYSLVRGDAADGKWFVRMSAKIPALRVSFRTLMEHFGDVRDILTVIEIVGDESGKYVLSGENLIWRDAYSGFEHRFPYGLLAGRPQRADRLAEDTALRTERICAMVEWSKWQGKRGKRKAEGNEKLTSLLDDIWRLILIGQHHDAWVCAPVIFGIWRHGYKTYAELTYAASEEALRLCDEAIKEVGITRDKSVPTSKFVLVNVCGFGRDEVVPFKIELPKGVARQPVLALKVGKKFEPLPTICEVLSRHGDGSAKIVKGWLFAKKVPSVGYFRISVFDENAKLKPLPMPKAKARKVEEFVVLENSFVRIVVGRNGLLETFAPDGKPLLSAPAEILGRFEDGDQKAVVESVEILSDGPMAGAKARCRIGKLKFEMQVWLSPVSPIVKLALDFDFGERTVVGVGEPIPKGSDPKIPVWARDDLKLRLMLPLNMKSPKFLGHNAFELRQPYEDRLPILRCAIAHDDENGVAIYTDRATMGLFDTGKREMGIVLAYGGSFIYAPNSFAPLTGREHFDVGLYFFKGSPEEAMVVQRAEEFSQPLLLVPVSQKSPFISEKSPLLQLEPQSGAVISSVYPTKEGTLVRLWRPYGGTRRVKLTIDGANSIWLADLRGNPQKQLVKGNAIALGLKSSEIVTLLAKVSNEP